jgi:hypothetical protein
MSTIAPMVHRRASGKIAYTSRKPEFHDVQRGQEWFTFTYHADGCVTFRAHCEIWDPQPTVLRDIIYSLDARGLPADCHVRLTIGDAFMGSGWFLFDLDDTGSGLISCESYGPATGRVSQQQNTQGSFAGFGTHPIVGDAYLTRCMDVSKGPHRRSVRCFLPSADHRGATPPLISEVQITIEYVGDEEITVQAGAFAARHFRFLDESPTGMGGVTHPAYDMWVTADADSLFLKGGVGGYMQTWYELVELEC